MLYEREAFVVVCVFPFATNDLPKRLLLSVAAHSNVRHLNYETVQHTRLFDNCTRRRRKFLENNQAQKTKIDHALNIELHGGFGRLD
jgi:hypothetical protein